MKEQEFIDLLSKSRLKIRPVARRVTENGRHLSKMDGTWILTSFERGVAKIENTRTHHVAKLMSDHVVGFDPQCDRNGIEHGLLRLRAQISLSSIGTKIEMLLPSLFAERPPHPTLSPKGGEGF